MYHFDVNCGESPDLATVNEAPLESYVGLPWGVKESDAPFVKSTVTDLPRAGSAGQLPVHPLVSILRLGVGPFSVHTTCEGVAGRVSLSYRRYS